MGEPATPPDERLALQPRRATDERLPAAPLQATDERLPAAPLQVTDERAAHPPLRGASSLLGSLRERRVRHSHPHAYKFRIATAVLSAIALIAIASAIAIAAHSKGGGPAPAWSAWRPPDNGAQGARDIAGHLAPLYRISPADQLDAITVLNVPSPSFSAGTATPPNQVQIAISNDGTLADVSLLGGQTIAYNLCSLQDANCSIGPTTASSDLMLLLRREGLELALYTFKYLSGVDNVVALMPPATTAQTATLSATPPPAHPTQQPLDLALVFDRQELTPFLSQPLSATLAPLPPTVPQLTVWRTTEEAGLVDQLTARALYSYRYVANPGGGKLLVLSALPPQ
jgi:hypothetical protein